VSLQHGRRPVIDGSLEVKLVGVEDAEPHRNSEHLIHPDKPGFFQDDERAAAMLGVSLASKARDGLVTLEGLPLAHAALNVEVV
jgi:hypothetical protein